MKFFLRKTTVKTIQQAMITMLIAGFGMTAKADFLYAPANLGPITINANITDNPNELYVEKADGSWFDDYVVLTNYGNGLYKAKIDFRVRSKGMGDFSIRPLNKLTLTKDDNPSLSFTTISHDLLIAEYAFAFDYPLDLRLPLNSGVFGDYQENGYNVMPMTLQIAAKAPQPSAEISGADLLGNYNGTLTLLVEPGA